MALDAGTRLGAYEILAPLGAGGMGEVYRAHDTKLKRDVAIKVLLPSVAADAERLERLRREAQVLASLNHPHIAAIYGLEEQDGQPYLVLELVEGPALSEKMSEGPIPLDKALPIAKQMAEALAEAHEKGIIHRDLKPGNVKLTPEGRVKLLDFGLAKALAGDSDGSRAPTDLSQSPTLSRQATAAGLILGTAAYMSPEQAKGKSVDRRTDVWAFGAVLYEMLTGKHLFHGEDVSEILAAVLRAEPDWNALPADTPPSIRRLLRRCLEKDRERRLDSMRAGWLEIEEARQHPQEETSTSPRVPRWNLALAGLLVFVLGGFVVRVLAPFEPPGSRLVTRFPVMLPSGSVVVSTRPALAISPDGAHIVYATLEGMLHLRAMDSEEPTPIPGTEGARVPFFSPDGQWVGFAAFNEIRKVSITGGAPISLCRSVGRPGGASWGADDTIIFSIFEEGVFRCSGDGGAEEGLALDQPSVVGPQLLPDGKAILFSTPATYSQAGWQVVVHSLETGESHVLIEAGFGARYVPTGHLVYGLDNSLLAVPFDLERLEITGGAVPVVDDVTMDGGSFGGGFAQFAVSDSGTLAYLPGEAVDASTLVWVDREGNARPVTELRRSYERPRLSRDGARVAIQIATGGAPEVWALELQRGVLTRLTFEGGWRPIWTPDGSRIVFAKLRPEGRFDIFSTPVDGNGSVEQLTEGAYRIPDSISPDGKTLLFRQQGGETGRDIGALSLDGEGDPEILLGTGFDEMHGMVSPNGGWIAYSSNESGEREIYVQSFPELGGKTQISTDGGTEPEWSVDGNELFYLDGDAMMAVGVSTGSELEPSRPVKLFEGSYVRAPERVSQSYDVAPDGRFVMVRSGAGAGSTDQRINVVLNWFEELKARVPTE